MNNELNILECFDDSIGNLDITKNYIYVLKLIEDRYYIGRTSNIVRRIQEHFSSNGSVYTKKYKPIKVIEIEEELGSDDERNKTLLYMKKYGYEKVRGYVWCRIELLKDPCKEHIINICNSKNLFNKRKCEIDDRIKCLYFEDDKNIMEIGEILNRSPGSIAWSLYNSGLVERIQLTRGYLEYINSDMYKEKVCFGLKKERTKRGRKERVINSSKNLDAILLKKNIREILNKNKDVLEIKNKLRDLLSSECL
jgi:predicted GIY-YIG superfamily endonuclease